MSDSVRPHGRQPTRLPHPWDSPGKNTGVGCHFLLQCMKVKSESEVAQSCPTLETPWTTAYQAPPSMGFSRQKYWSGVPWCRKKTKWTLLNTSLRMKASFELKQFFIFIQIGKQLLKGSLGLIRPETESGNIKIKKMLCSWFFNILASPVFLTIQFFFFNWLP